MAKVKVKLLTSRASLDGTVGHEGDVLELDASEARALLDAGQAEPVAQRKRSETTAGKQTTEKR